MGNVRIVSDGTPQGTKVYDEHGEQIEQVTRITFDMDAENRPFEFAELR